MKRTSGNKDGVKCISAGKPVTTISVKREEETRGAYPGENGVMVHTSASAEIAIVSGIGSGGRKCIVMKSPPVEEHREARRIIARRKVPQRLA